MIALHSDMILTSVIFTSVLGVLSGGAYSLLRHLLWRIRKVFVRILGVKNNSERRHSILLNLFDGFFVFTVGLVYMLSSYTLVDGVLEIYSIIALLIGIVAGKRALDGILLNTMKM